MEFVTLKNINKEYKMGDVVIKAPQVQAKPPFLICLEVWTVPPQGSFMWTAHL